MWVLPFVWGRLVEILGLCRSHILCVLRYTFAPDNKKQEAGHWSLLDWTVSYCVDSGDFSFFFLSLQGLVRTRDEDKDKDKDIGT